MTLRNLGDLPVLLLPESFALTAAYNDDQFPNKVNLGQGVYRDNNCQPWVLPSVREVRLLLPLISKSNSSISYFLYSISGRRNPTQPTSQPRIPPHSRRLQIPGQSPPTPLRSSNRLLSREYLKPSDCRRNRRKSSRCAILRPKPLSQKCFYL